MDWTTDLFLEVIRSAEFLVFVFSTIILGLYKLYQNYLEANAEIYCRLISNKIFSANRLPAQVVYDMTEKNISIPPFGMIRFAQLGFFNTGGDCIDLDILQKNNLHIELSEAEKLIYQWVIDVSPHFGEPELNKPIRNGGRRPRVQIEFQDSMDKDDFLTIGMIYIPRDSAKYTSDEFRLTSTNPKGLNFTWSDYYQILVLSSALLIGIFFSFLVFSNNPLISIFSLLVIIILNWISLRTTSRKYKSSQIRANRRSLKRA